MEHSLVCLAEKGREGLELVKQQINSLVRPSFIQGAFWELRTRLLVIWNTHFADSDLMIVMMSDLVILTFVCTPRP